MLRYPRPLQRVIEELERLPGIGPRSAQRLAFVLLRRNPGEVRALGEAIATLPEAVCRCRECFNYAESDLCPVCADPGRDQSVLCVVADPADAMAIERANDYRGLYHVLGGLLSPLDGIGPEDLSIPLLVGRLGRLQPAEIILATTPSVEGDATAEHLRQVLSALGFTRITRPALGLAVGAELDYADQVTLVRALQGRREM
jgi:recombination protein RecR